MSGAEQVMHSGLQLPAAAEKDAMRAVRESQTVKLWVRKLNNELKLAKKLVMLRGAADLGDTFL